MRWSTRAQNCLYLNWALPLKSAPPLPSSLRYEVHAHDGQDYVFVSALLFRLAGLHCEALPLLKLSYPQMNVRLYVLDSQGRPSVLFRRMLVPSWVVPLSRLVGRQPATPARLLYPHILPAGDGETWRWKVQGPRRLEVQCRLASPAPGPGPDMGGWQQTVEYFRLRPQGYIEQGGSLRSIRATRPGEDVVPLAAEVSRWGLLQQIWGAESEAMEASWQRPHSAWLCPEIPLAFELGKPLRLPLASRSVAAVRGTSYRANP